MKHLGMNEENNCSVDVIKGSAVCVMDLLFTFFPFCASHHFCLFDYHRIGQNVQFERYFYMDGVHVNIFFIL